MSISAIRFSSLPNRFLNGSPPAGQLPTFTPDNFAPQFAGSAFPGRKAGLTLHEGRLKDLDEILSFFYRIEQEDYGQEYTPAQQDYLKTYYENLLKTNRNPMDYTRIARNPAGEIVALSFMKATDAKTATIDTIYMAPQYRGLGIGDWMVKQQLKHAKKYGIKMVLANARPVSVYLLAKYGFEIDREGIRQYRDMTRNHPDFKSKMPYMIPLKLDLTV